MAAIARQRARAKINLALHITGQRDDGLHELQSLVVFADIGDELRASESESDTLTLSGPFAGELTGASSNLVTQAVDLFRQRWPEAVPYGVAIELCKNLPVASGIGGGSADAAAALRIMASLSTLDIAAGELAELGLSLGADVPVCLGTQPCWMSGVGQDVRQLDAFPSCHLVLINPRLPIATADSFRLLKNRQNPALPDFSNTIVDVAALAAWLAATRNDLQGVAVSMHPVIEQIVGQLQQSDGCAFARMSGSGATVFGLFATAEKAASAVTKFRAIWPDFWMVSSPVILPGQ